MYYKFSNVNIIDTLQVVVDNNTPNLKSDFNYDKKNFAEHLKNHNDKENFLWLSKENGTHCYTEYETYIEDTSPNNTWQYNNGGNKNFKAFLIKGRNENGELKGDIYQLDYLKHQQERIPY